MLYSVIWLDQQFISKIYLFKFEYSISVFELEFIVLKTKCSHETSSILIT